MLDFCVIISMCYLSSDDVDSSVAAMASQLVCGLGSGCGRGSWASG